MRAYSRLVTGATALLFASSALAAPVAQLAPLDPLVVVSALGTPQSRTAVAPAVTAGAAQVVTYPPPPPGWPANRYPRPNQYYPGAWVLIPGLFGLLAILVLHMTDDDDNEFVPVSP